MRKIAAVGAMTLLAFIAVFHLIWATGTTWPATDLDEFQRMFYGDPGPMPPLWTGAILAGILLVAAVFLGLTAWARLPKPGWLWRVGLWTMAVVFGLRGIVGYIPGMNGTYEPYLTLNATLYNPLCLAIMVLTVLVLLPRRTRPHASADDAPPIPDAFV